MARILLACSGFKDVLNGTEVCQALKKGFLAADSTVNVTCLPLSDGGEGFLDALRRSSLSGNIEIHKVLVTGPLGFTVEGEYGIFENGNNRVGIIEMARLSGIEKVPVEMRNPYHTTSHGTGEVIQLLYSRGINEFYIGLGGSATTDGGLSVLYALKAFKFEFSNHSDYSSTPPAYLTGSMLSSIKSITSTDPSMSESLSLTIACDVKNPMLGPSGSVKVFGPQKGILPEMEEDYEKIMENVNHLLSGIRGVNIGHSEFSGAAGGISGGLLAAFSKCSVVRGVDLVAQASGLTQLVEQADLVISGEGSFDAQTKGGKVVSKVLEICPRAVVVCGIVKGVDYRNVYDLVSRFGNRSVSHVKECLEIVALEIFEKEILNGRRG